MLVLLLSTLWCVGGYSQKTPEVTLDFSKTEWGLPSTAKKAEQSYTCDGYTVKFGQSTDGHKAQLQGVMMGKKDATLTLPSFDFDVEKIILRKNTGTVSGKVTFNIFVEDKAASTQVTGCDKDATFQIAEDYQTAGNIYTIKVTNTKNLQFSKIEIYKKASTGTPTTIAFNDDFDFTKTYTFTEGVAPSDYTQPTVTLSTIEATGKGAIEYTSSNTNVVGVDKTTGALSFVGKTLYDTEATISAQFVATAGSDYANSNKLTYKVKNVEKQKTATTLKFAEPSGSINIGEAFTLPTLTLTAGEETLTGKTYSYKSSNQEVATVDKSGNVTIKSSGTTDITATYEGDDVYAMSYDTYKLTVVDPNKKEIIFVAGTDIDTQNSVGKEGIKVSTKNSNLKDNPEYRFYSNNPVTISSTVGKISKIQFEYTQSKFQSCTPGLLNETKDIWTGSATEITFTHSVQVRVSKIIVTLEPTVKKPTLSFSKESVTVMQGKEKEFTAPTLTLLDAEGNPVVNDILISYSVSPAEGIVSISNETGDITKWIAPGTATVTAEVLSANKAYEGMTASYTINYVKDPNAVTAFSSVSDLWLALSTDELKDGDKVKVTLTDAKVVYINEYSTNTEVFIREAESAVDFFNLGVDFTNNAIVNGTIQGKIQESYGMFRLTADGANTIPSDLTITASDEAAVPVDITNKEITDYTYNYVSFLGLADESNIIYNNSNTSITLYDKFKKGIAFPYAEASVKITGIAIPYKKDATSGTIYEIIPTDKYGVVYLFDDNTDNTVGKVDDAKVALTRTLVGDKWNTFCVPFGISENDVKTVLNNSELREYGSMNGTTMNFTPATSITAGKAYLVKPTADVVNPAFEGVSIIATDPTTTDGDNGYIFQGTYSKKPLATDGTNLFLGADMKFYVPAAETNVMKGLRAYFVVPADPSASKMDINIDGELTNICNIENGMLTNGKVYNLNGQYIGNSLNNLQKGIYIVNGRKVMK